MEWENILPSTIIAAVITGIIELFRLNNNNKATYIIKQREEWRDKIRNITTDINKANKYNIDKPLTELKTRVNPYGKLLNDTKSEDYYLKDGHINLLIEQIENEITLNSEECKVNLEKHKAKLVSYLSLLVKYDWDRSKREIAFDKTIVISLIFEIIGCIFYGLSIGKFVDELICALCILILLYFFPIVFIVVNKGQKYKKMISASTVLFVICNVLNILTLIWGTIIQQNYLIFSGVFMLLASALLTIYTIINLNAERDYIKALNKLESEYYFPDSKEEPKETLSTNFNKVFIPIIFIWNLFLTIISLFLPLIRWFKDCQNFLNQYSITEKKKERKLKRELKKKDRKLKRELKKNKRKKNNKENMDTN